VQFCTQAPQKVEKRENANKNILVCFCEMGNQNPWYTSYSVHLEKNTKKTTQNKSTPALLALIHVKKNRMFCFLVTQKMVLETTTSLINMPLTHTKQNTSCFTVLSCLRVYLFLAVCFCMLKLNSERNVRKDILTKCSLVYQGGRLSLETGTAAGERFLVVGFGAALASG
jgi:hypothetical protein